jgi:hypothetical protein
MHPQVPAAEGLAKRTRSMPGSLVLFGVKHQQDAEHYEQQRPYFLE